jgi:isoquinoline 1-oxidoreductase
MNRRTLPFEMERYELYDASDFALELNRRDFFRVVGAGLVVGFLLRDGAGEAFAQRPGGGPVPNDLAAWLHIGEDSKITVYTGKVEIGQNIRTSLTQVVAEELHAPPGQITFIMADTQLVPTDMGTFGSQTTPRMAPQLRKVAATARELLLDMAAEEGKVERASLTIKDGKVVGPEGKPSFEFGKLTKGKKLVKTIGSPATAGAKDWTTAGASITKVNGRDMVTGAHRYASDTKRPGMLFGKVLRPPAFKAELSSVDTKAAEAMPGVVVVHNGSFVGIAAPTEHAAEKALAAIKAEWKTNKDLPSSEEVYKYIKAHTRGGGGGFGRGPSRKGSIKDGLAAADKKLEATYTIAYIAHTPLETRTATAEWADDKLTVWTGTQRPFGIRSDVARALGVAPEKVRVIVPDMGSAYGGKHTNEAAAEAARLAKAAGKPVKLVWTREEEFTWAYFRPAGVIDLNTGVKKDGTLTAWEFHNYLSGGAALETPYAVPNLLTESHGAESPLASGSYRALASVANIFARESHMDDLAHAVEMDPLEFRLKNLEEKRLRAVLEAATKQFGWGKGKPPEGHGFGIACGTEKGGFVANCAEVAADKKSGRVKVVRMVTAFECGAILNPDQLKNQVEGGVIMALGGALFEAIQFANGKILNPRFADYRVPRFGDVPALETVLLDRKDLPSAGAGESPLIATAPAIGNAIFNATGIRVRSLPMVPTGLKET